MPTMARSLTSGDMGRPVAPKSSTGPRGDAYSSSKASLPASRDWIKGVREPCQFPQIKRSTTPMIPAKPLPETNAGDCASRPHMSRAPTSKSCLLMGQGLFTLKPCNLAAATPFRRLHEVMKRRPSVRRRSVAGRQKLEMPVTVFYHRGDVDSRRSRSAYSR